MKRFAISLLAVPLLVAGLAACGTETATQEASSTKTYNDYGISFEYPAELKTMTVRGNLRPDADEYDGMVAVTDADGTRVVMVQWLYSANLAESEQAIEALLRDFHEGMTLAANTEAGDWVPCPDFAGYPAFSRTYRITESDINALMFAITTFDGEHMHAFSSLRRMPATLQSLQPDVDALMESFTG